MKKAIIIYFSPTHSTKKVLSEIALGLGFDEVIEVDLTNIHRKVIDFTDIDLVMLGCPVYSGRVPAKAKERFMMIPNGKIPAVIVSVYGNIGYGNALKELEEMMKVKGFVIIGGAAFIGEHSFSSKKHEIAKDRPNGKDLEMANEFGGKIKEKLCINTYEELRNKSINMPGELSEKKAGKMPKMASKANKDCIKCMKCISVCPVGAINEGLVCDANKCIKCFACVKSCPSNARELKNPILSIVGILLSKAKYKEPKLFI